MSLSATDKDRIKKLWSKISSDSDDIGNEALGRMFAVYPATKTYFLDWQDYRTGSQNVVNHGKVVMTGIKLAYQNMDDMINGLMELSEKHAFVLRIDPNNFKSLFTCIHVVLAAKFPSDYSEEAHLSFDKFLANVALALSEKYR